MLTTDQHLMRRRGIAASELAAIMGLHPWKGPTDVYRTKVTDWRDDADNVRADWGNRLEDPIRAWYADTLGVEVTVPGTLFHPTDAIAIATPDGVVYPPLAANPRNGLEIKAHTINLRHLYGTPGTDEAPAWELIQCAWNMYVTGLPFWHLVAFIDGLPTIYRIERDLELERLCIEAAHDFWNQHVVPRIPPPPDGTRSFNEDLLRRFPAATRAQILAAGEAELANARELRNVQDQLWTLGRREAVLEQRLKLAIGDAPGLAWKEGPRTESITWKRSRDGAKTDWEAVALERGAAADLAQSAARAVLERAVASGDLSAAMALGLAAAMGLAEQESTAAIVTRRTVVVPGSRRFCVPRSWSRERPTDIEIDRTHKEHRR